MSKGAQTRERIIQQAAEVFNQQGYFGTSLSDLVRATGLEKGGIYNHFSGKEQIALEAFDYAYGLLRQRTETAIANETDAVARLQAFVAAFASQVEAPALAGGCPVLNTAIEADDTHPALCARAHAAVAEWLDVIRQIVQTGVAAGTIRADVDADAVATMLVATLEGSVMLSKLMRDRAHTRQVVAHLTPYLEQLRA